MKTNKSAGRIVAVLLLAQAVAGGLASFALLAAATAPPGFLANAAPNSVQVTFSMLLLLFTGALWVGMAITVLPVFRQHSHTMALWFLALTIVCFSGLLVEGVALRSMVALSQEYLKADAAHGVLFQAPGALLRSVRIGAHYTNLLLSGASLFVFYSVLFRFALLPLALASFGLVTVVLLIIGALIPLFGYPVVLLLFMPMGLSHFTVAIWLMVYGFEDRRHPRQPETSGRELPSQSARSF
jgi:hypothetical protein